VERIAELGIIRSRARRDHRDRAGMAGDRADARGAPAARAAHRGALRVAGIGPWTAHYIAMRALSWPDAFPAAGRGGAEGDEAPLRLRLAARGDARALAWQPWRAYAVLRLWNSLETHP
jgi:AraC family transcriptional regulator of adaptative response / DNA-3-methyladenine glycosylase II